MKLTNKQLKQIIKEELQNVLQEQDNFENEAKLSVLQDVLNGIDMIPPEQKGNLLAQVKTHTRHPDFPQTFENALSMALGESMPEISPDIKDLIIQQARSRR